MWHFVLGRSDPNEEVIALYHAPRPTSRLYRMSFTGDDWNLHREDPDFHQRFVVPVSTDRIEGRWDASEDHGATWRKDFDLIFERTVTRGSPRRRATVEWPPERLRDTGASGDAFHRRWVPPPLSHQEEEP